MSCPQCGFANSPNSTRCQKCGAGLAAAQPQQPAAQQQYAPPPQQPAAQQQYAPPPQQPVQVIVQQPQAQPQAAIPMVPPKSTASAALLAFLLGPLGIHNFYLGYTGRGIAQLILTMTFFGAFISVPWAFIEFIMILCGGIKDPQGRPLV